MKKGKLSIKVGVMKLKGKEFFYRVVHLSNKSRHGFFVRVHAVGFRCGYYRWSADRSFYSYVSGYQKVMVRRT